MTIFTCFGFGLDLSSARKVSASASTTAPEPAAGVIRRRSHLANVMFARHNRRRIVCSNYATIAFFPPSINCLQRTESLQGTALRKNSTSTELHVMVKFLYKKLLSSATTRRAAIATQSKHEGAYISVFILRGFPLRYCHHPPPPRRHHYGRPLPPHFLPPSLLPPLPLLPRPRFSISTIATAPGKSNTHPPPNKTATRQHKKAPGRAKRAGLVGTRPAITHPSVQQVGYFSRRALRHPTAPDFLYWPCLTDGRPTV